MSNIGKRMTEARRLEASGDLEGAIAVYRKALVAQEETAGFADLSLYNGLGDLYLRAGHLSEALSAYEGAAQRCEEQQLYANGIALCKKILRNAPDHLPAYRRVARLSALSGLEAEARLHYVQYRDRLSREGREQDAIACLREIVEATADEEAAIELADELVARGSTAAALQALRSVRDRRTADGRGVVILVRRIQELQPERAATGPGDEARAERRESAAGAPPPPAAAATDTEARPHPAPAQRSHGSPGRPPLTAKTPSRAVPEPAAQRAPQSRTPLPSVGLDPTSMPADAADLATLATELQACLSDLEGDERARRALALVEQMLEIQPGRFDLLHRKLAYAFALGDESATVSAYLGLGELLDERLVGFTVRTLSTSSENGAVTAAIKVEERSPLAPGSQG